MPVFKNTQHDLAESKRGIAGVMFRCGKADAGRRAQQRIRLPSFHNPPFVLKRRQAR